MARLAIDLENRDRADLLQDFVDLLTDASIPADVPGHGMYAMDETAVRAWNRPRGKRPKTTKDLTFDSPPTIVAACMRSWPDREACTRIPDFGLF